MDTLLAARLQMALSLGFHMLFAAAGVGMPLLMLIAEGLWLRAGRRAYLDLAKKWAKATAILFAIGAVSGTALAFELGLLWPRFMQFSGGIIGPAFSLEAYAFFLEAIFLGLYLYGWDRLRPRTHWLTGIPVAISGAASSVFVTATNAWMQSPSGFVLRDGRVVDVDPAGALFTPAWVVMATHSTLATYAATAFAVAAVYAWGALRGRRDRYHQAALVISLAVGMAVSALMPITGHVSAQWVARNQPAKLAAMEAQFRTERGAPLRIGGIPNLETETVPYALEIPRGLSWLAFADLEATVTGLDQIPRSDWPNVPLTHISFQIMIAAGFAMLGAAAAFWLVWWRRRGSFVQSRPLLSMLVAAGPLGYLALETGWIVTEVGRQPWTIYGVMRTSEAVTPAPGVAATFVGFMALYAALTATLVWLLRRLATGAPEGGEPSGRTRPKRPADPAPGGLSAAPEGEPDGTS